MRQRFTALGLNIKRAEGGYIDTCFLNLVERLQSLHCRDCIVFFSENRVIQQYLFLVKSVLHDANRAPRETALPDRNGTHVGEGLHVFDIAQVMDYQVAVLHRIRHHLTC